VSTKFHPVKGVPVQKQGLVYYSMQNTDKASPDVINACERAIYYICNNETDKAMLREYVTTGRSCAYVADKHFCEPRRLKRLYKKYMRYAVWFITAI